MSLIFALSAVIWILKFNSSLAADNFKKTQNLLDIKEKSSFNSNSEFLNESSSSLDSVKEFLNGVKGSKNFASEVTRMVFQRPWCPGESLASIIPFARDPIYRWLKSPLTCLEFARRFGNIDIEVTNYELGSVLCKYSAEHNNTVKSNYAAIRAVLLNLDSYGSVFDQGDEKTYAAASGLIFQQNGIVLLISIAKDVNQLPQFC